MKSESGEIVEFGKRENFGIRAVFDGWVGKYCFGRLVFFIASKQFGDWEVTPDLATSGRWTRTYLENRKKSDRFDVAEFDAAYLLWRLHGSHVQPRYPREYKTLIQNPSWYEEIGDKRSQFRLLTTIGGAATIDTAAVLVIPQADQTDRVLAFDYEHEEIGDATVDSAEFEEILNLYAEWVENL